jgi:hypothetical protein
MLTYDPSFARPYDLIMEGIAIEWNRNLNGDQH